MKKSALLLFHCFLFIVVTTSAQNPYEIKGLVPGAKEGLKLYLEETAPIRKKLDSTQVSNGVFSFRGSMEGAYKQVLIITANPSSDGLDYKSFWLEPGKITIDGKQGKLRGSEIGGSSIQDIATSLQKQTQVYDLADDSLVNIRSGIKDTALRTALLKQVQNVRKQRQNAEMDFVKDNPNTVYSAYILSVYSSTWGKEKTAVLYEGLSDQNKSSWYGKNVAEYISLSRNIKIGDVYADFEQPDKAGISLKLSSLVKDKYVLLDFWASWCGPCREDNPLLVKTYAAFKDKGFEILGVSLDDNKQNWLEAITTDKLTWPNVSELRGDKNKAALMYNVSGIPDNYLIGKDGKIIAHNLRGQKLYDKLAELLK